MGRYTFTEPIYDKHTHEKIREEPISVDVSKLERRLRLDRPNVPRLKTGIGEFDALTGGLPYGLTIFLGDGGTGKSKLAKFIAERTNSLYLCAESLVDAPSGPRVKVVDYVRYQPSSDVAVRQLFGLIMMLEPDVVFVDSLTIFLSGTRAAVMEADVREATFKINAMCEGIIPIVGISEMRGKGAYAEPAGGKAIIHAGSLLLNFSKVKVDHFSAKRYRAAEDSFVWTVSCDKDRQGLAKQAAMYQVAYDSDGVHFRDVPAGE